MESVDHRHYEEQVAAYLLGALEQDEAIEFGAHLESCERCRADERWLRPALDVLPTSVPQLEAPPALKTRLLDTVRADAAADQRTSERPAAPKRRWALSLRPALALAVAGVIAAAAVGGYVIGDSGSGETTTTINAGTGRQPGARATLVRAGDSAVVRVQGLPVQRPGHVYQLWLRRQRTIEPSSLFVVGRDGSGSAGIPAGIDGTREVMVTIEPEGGSTTPSMEPLLRVRI